MDRPPSGIISLRTQSQGNQGTMMERHKNRPHMLLDVVDVEGKAMGVGVYKGKAKVILNIEKTSCMEDV